MFVRWKMASSPAGCSHICVAALSVTSDRMTQSYTPSACDNFRGKFYLEFLPGHRPSAVLFLPFPTAEVFLTCAIRHAHVRSTTKRPGGMFYTHKHTHTHTENPYHIHWDSNPRPPFLKVNVKARRHERLNMKTEVQED